MTIDQALSEIEVKEKEKLEADITNDFELFTKAHEILGDYLIETFFPNKAKNIVASLKILGPFIIQIAPHKPFGHKYCAYDCSLIDTLSGEIFLNCLRTFSEGYLESTDLVQEIESEINLKKQGEKYLPGFRSLESEVNGEKDVPKVSAYTFVMGMKPEYRSFMALAIERAIKNNEIEVYEYSNSKNRKEKLLSTVPSLKDITGAAEEYNITQLKDIIIDLSRIVSLYEEVW